MRIIKGDLFRPVPAVDAICIPTNGLYYNGRATMGAGVAKVARDKWTGLDLRLGECLKKGGNRVHVLTITDEKDFDIVSFPTKHHWKDPSDLELIEKSAQELYTIADLLDWSEVWLPVVGCGLGKLNWPNQVEPLLSSVLDDDRFAIVMKG